MPTADNTTASQKALVCLASFACACLGFAAAVLFLVPAIGTLFTALDAPEAFTAMLIFAALFGTPIAGAFAGLQLSASKLSAPAA